ncbi:MAG: glycerate kinase [Cyclobacteriaceae bacterium]
MKIIIAPDKFKGSLTAREVCEIVQSELLKKFPEAEIISVPLADGGEGTCDLLTQLSDGKRIEVNVHDPLQRMITAGYGISGDGNTAFIEMAAASGLQLLQPRERNCTITSTYGTGQLIVHALEKGVKEIVMGIGGSATNDAGLGMAKALGYRLFSHTDEELEGIGSDLIRLNHIDSSHKHPKINDTQFITLCDVINPLYGKDGAAHVFAQQKGATDDEIVMLDQGLQNFATIAEKIELNFSGAGAAGGLGAGTKFFLNAEIFTGIDFLIRYTGLEEKIKDSDVVITGEGKLDHQTLSGKVVSGVASLACKHHKKLIVMAGSCELDQEQINEMGIAQVITLQDQHISESEAINKAADLLKSRVAQIHY